MKLIDFGYAVMKKDLGEVIEVSRRADLSPARARARQRATRGQSVVGTPYYIAPEIFSNYTRTCKVRTHSLRKARQLPPTALAGVAAQRHVERGRHYAHPAARPAAVPRRQDTGTRALATAAASLLTGGPTHDRYRRVRPWRPSVWARSSSPTSQAT